MDNKTAYIKKYLPDHVRTGRLACRRGRTLMLLCLLCLSLSAFAAPKQNSLSAKSRRNTAVSTTEPNITVPAEPSSHDTARQNNTTGPSNIIDPNSSTDRQGIAGLSVKADSPSMPIPNNQLTHHLWNNRISAPISEVNTPDKDELCRLIDQVRSIRFESPSYDTHSIALVEQSSPRLTGTQAASIYNTSELKTRLADQNVNSSMLPQILTDQTIKAINNLLPHPEQVQNPFEIAELLFTCGRFKEAAVFYRQALSTISPDDPQAGENKAWLLFQIGNCMRQDNPSSAKETYLKLISEYPSSLWTDIAKIRGRMINWSEKTDLGKLLSEPNL